jgi:tRNA-2-methylthio-N6-dimethylallyladenosine synthase
MKYHIVTFGCAANVADSERLASYYQARGDTEARSIKSADSIIINTCMVRQMAEDRVYGLIRNILQEKQKGRKVKIVLTGCMVGMAVRDSSGRMLEHLKKRMPEIDEFLPIEEVGFDYEPLRTDKLHALVSISNGCNNFCSYCVVPFTRGREVSRPFEDIITECQDLASKGFTHITLVGQNVNSYGADLIKLKIKNQKSKVQVKNQKFSKITYVEHLGRLRIPTLFPELLREICKIKGIHTIDFISSNPWDFSDDLIRVIAKNPKISRAIHLPVQSGDAEILKKMNRWYTPDEYIELVKKLRKQITDITISTDIIVGFCGETKEQFQHTIDLCKKVGFSKAYLAMYSDRPLTRAHRQFKDDVPYTEKKRRWKILENLINKNLINKPNIRSIQKQEKGNTN